jgi:hypothetical protein
VITHTHTHTHQVRASDEHAWPLAAVTSTRLPSRTLRQLARGVASRMAHGLKTALTPTFDLHEEFSSAAAGTGVGGSKSASDDHARSRTTAAENAPVSDESKARASSVGAQSAVVAADKEGGARVLGFFGRGKKDKESSNA